jgi:hypothetical protein
MLKHHQEWDIHGYPLPPTISTGAGFRNHPQVVVGMVIFKELLFPGLTLYVSKHETVGFYPFTTQHQGCQQGWVVRNCQASLTTTNAWKHDKPVTMYLLL